jgi:mono/diheme cytochrome c family protein
MSTTQNPRVDPPAPPPINATVQPGAPDFVEVPDAEPTPATEHESLPWWLYLICGFALFLAGSSFTGFEGMELYDQGPGAAMLAENSGPAAPAAPLSQMDIGKQVYDGNCANCHQASGAGQPGSYPPLGGSEYVNGDPTALSAIMLHGLQGPVTVEGGAYGSQQMPGWATVLNDEKIAGVMTYIRASWGNKADAVKPADVSAARAKFASQSDAYTMDTLMKASNNKK